VKEVSHERIMMLEEENELLMRKAEEYVNRLPKSMATNLLESIVS